jgi:hypothetical protein
VKSKKGKLKEGGKTRTENIWKQNVQRESSDSREVRKTTVHNEKLRKWLTTYYALLLG